MAGDFWKSLAKKLRRLREKRRKNKEADRKDI